MLPLHVHLWNLGRPCRAVKLHFCLLSLHRSSPKTARVHLLPVALLDLSSFLSLVPLVSLMKYWSPLAVRVPVGLFKTDIICEYSFGKPTLISDFRLGGA